ncbi:MAG: hypothetical protein R2827_16410 [Bdellovibrionales bacterium]
MGFLIRPANRISLAKLIIQVFSEQVSANDVGEKARSKVVAALRHWQYGPTNRRRLWAEFSLSTGRYAKNDLVDYLKVEA